MKTLQIYALSVGKDCRFNTRILLCLLLRARLLGLNKRKKQKAVFFKPKTKARGILFLPCRGWNAQVCLKKTSLLPSLVNSHVIFIFFFTSDFVVLYRQNTSVHLYTFPIY